MVKVKKLIFQPTISLGTPTPLRRWVRIPPMSLCESYKAIKGNPVPGSITGLHCHWEKINIVIWSPRLVVGCKADNLAL
jgi:hypothetical protein